MDSELAKALGQLESEKDAAFKGLDAQVRQGAPLGAGRQHAGLELVSAAVLGCATGPGAAACVQAYCVQGVEGVPRLLTRGSVCCAAWAWPVLKAAFIFSRTLQVGKLSTDILARVLPEGVKV